MRFGLGGRDVFMLLGSDGMNGWINGYSIKGEYKCMRWNAGSDG